MTPEEIWEDGKSRTAVERETGAAWNKYRDACVNFTLPLSAIFTKGDVFEVHLRAGRLGLLSVATKVRTVDYPELALVNEGAPLTVRGQIVFVQDGFMALHDAILNVPKEQPAAE